MTPLTGYRGSTRAASIGIIEPERLLIPFLSQLFSEAGFIVVTSLNAIKIDELARTEPANVFIDVDYLNIDRSDEMTRLRALLPDAVICGYTSNTSGSWARACVRAGINCVIAKAAAPAEIIDAVKHATRGSTLIDPRISSDPDVPE